ncbi:hypothetical protein ACXYN8_03310 [Altererythrobacter sp. CAU 1778]
MKGAAFRGQPLLLLTVVVFGWIGLRAAIWEPASSDTARLAGYADFSEYAAKQPAVAPTASHPASIVPSDDTEAPHFAPVPIKPAPHLTDDPVTAWSRPGFAGPVAHGSAFQRRDIPAVHLSAGHNILLAAGLSHVALPSELSAALMGAQPSPRATPAAGFAAVRPATSRTDRWSLDSWLFVRPGGGSKSIVSGPTYGRSQAGAVARYRLAPSSPLRPALFARTTTALEGAREAESALGATIRPIAKLPISLAAEGRVSRFAERTELRPAAYAVTEIAPVEGPLGLRATTYAQAGYVGGRFATPFVDGQLSVDREVFRLETLPVRAGLGAWGGAQKGSGRLDIGPTASLGVSVGDVDARLSADWRFRVAGEAAPGSGPAVTLTAGF